MTKTFNALLGGLALCALFSSGAQAMEPSKILNTECHKQLNLGEAGCNCIAEESKKLSEKQQLLVVAMVTRDLDKSAEVRSTMTLEEIADAAKFMSETPVSCGLPAE